MTKKQRDAANSFLLSDGVQKHRFAKRSKAAVEAESDDEVIEHLHVLLAEDDVSAGAAKVLALLKP